MTRLPRFTVMSVPGRGDDGSDTWWYVLDRKTRRSTEIGATDTAQAIAIGRVRELNARKARRR